MESECYTESECLQWWLDDNNHHEEEAILHQQKKGWQKTSHKETCNIEGARLRKTCSSRGICLLKMCSRRGIITGGSLHISGAADRKKPLPGWKVRWTLQGLLMANRGGGFWGWGWNFSVEGCNSARYGNLIIKKVWGVGGASSRRCSSTGRNAGLIIWRRKIPGGGWNLWMLQAFTPDQVNRKVSSGWQGRCRGRNRCPEQQWVNARNCTNNGGMPGWW